MRRTPARYENIATSRAVRANVGVKFYEPCNSSNSNLCGVKFLSAGERRRAARNLRSKAVCATRNFIKRKRRRCVQMRKTRAQKKRRPIRRVEFIQRSPRVRAEKFHRDARRLNIIAPKRTDRLGTLPRRAVHIVCDLRAACRVVRHRSCRSRIAPRHCRRIGIATDIVSAMRRAHSKDSVCGTARMRKRGEILKFARPDL